MKPKNNVHLLTFLPVLFFISTSCANMNNYISTLSGSVLQRYLEKISVIGFDPYAKNLKEFSSDKSALPPVEDIDVSNYLLHKISHYTYDQYKNYKSLEAYKFCIDGWVRDLSFLKVDKFFVFRSKVNFLYFDAIFK